MKFYYIANIFFFKKKNHLSYTIFGEILLTAIKNLFFSGKLLRIFYPKRITSNLIQIFPTEKEEKKEFDSHQNGVAKKKCSS